jgi:hypothetical protein
MVGEAGRLAGWPGTRFGVEGLLAAATGARASVIDSGGVFGRTDTRCHRPAPLWWCRWTRPARGRARSVAQDE